MGRAATAGRRRGTGQRKPAVRRQRSGGTQPAIRGDLFQMRRAIVHRRGLEMVHLLEVRRDEHGNDRLMATISKFEIRSSKQLPETSKARVF